MPERRNRADGRDTADAGGSREAHEPDSRLVRRLRWKLIAWSAGSTLAVLLILGAGLYFAVASSLASATEARLRDRASLIVASTVSSSPGGGSQTVIVATADASAQGLAFGGPYSGTLAIVLPIAAGSSPGGPTSSPPPAVGALPSGGVVPVVGGPLNAEGFAAAARGETVVREADLNGTPVTVLSAPTGNGASRAVVQVVEDRSDEVRTLSTLLLVLVLAGAAALLGSVGLGYVYAGRAMAPIRASMRRQREFAADTSHELRTPLAIIRGSVEHLRRHDDSPVRDVGAALDDIETEVVHVSALVDDLLLLARTDAGAMELDREPLDLADMAADALAGLERLAASRDMSAAYRDGCWIYSPFSTRTTCKYGKGTIRIALVGNSHAGHWLPMLQVLAKRNGWQITTFQAYREYRTRKQVQEAAKKKRQRELRAKRRKEKA